MTRFASIVCVVGALGLGACKKSSEETPAQTEPVKTEPAPAPMADAAEAEPPKPTGATDMANKAGNCPSTVTDATTEIDDKAPKGKLVLKITSKNAGATETIRKRAKHLVEVQGAPDQTIEHTGEGTGGGGKGVCPVVTKSTKVAVDDIDGGAKITLEPVAPLTFDALKADVEKRMAAAADYRKANVKPSDASGGGGGTGGGKGDHGGNHSGEGDGQGQEREAAKKKDPGAK